MKILKALSIGILFSILVLSANFISKYRLNELVKDGQIPYGPLPASLSQSYSFFGLENAFNEKLPIKRASEFSRDELKNIILSSLPEKRQVGLKPFLNSILSLSEEYQVDPFWVTSIIMVESNFDLSAVSAKNARGLMQIRPDTAQHLYQLMQRKLTNEEVHQNLHLPDENIEIGIFYLKKLLQNFRMNYSLATVAYNIGPQKLRNRLFEKSLDVLNFSYLVKVREHYNVFAQNFSQILLSKGLPYESTYVFSEQGLKRETQYLSLFNDYTSENLTFLTIR